MKIYRFKKEDYRKCEMPLLVEKLKKEGKKHLRGFCHKLNRFFIIVW